MTPLYGHTSIDTAYLVTNYPWGFTLKTEKQFWIEFKESKGFRFCSRTKDPKKDRWCEPKNGTYCALAMCMYLDEKEHVTYSCLTEYSSAKDIQEFVGNFPGAVTDRLKDFVKLQAVYYRRAVEKTTDETRKTQYLADADGLASIVF